jgi:hypothetical protein
MTTVRLILSTGEWVVGDVDDLGYEQLWGRAPGVEWVRITVTDPSKRESVRRIQMRHVVSVEDVPQAPAA